MPTGAQSLALAWAGLLGVIAPGALRAQCPDGTPPPCAAAPGPSPRSVAVLTFENITRDTTAQFLAEGLADQIFTRLSQVSRLTVISRSTVRRLRNADQLSVQQIGRALNVAYLVNGSIRMAGGRLRVNVEALRAATGAAIWSSAFDRAQDDLLGLEEAIAGEVAAGVAGRLTPQEQLALQRRSTSSQAAYTDYLRGNVQLARRTARGFAGGIAAYRAAIAADPMFANAHARLAYAYALCLNWGSVTAACGGEADSLLAWGRRAADRAISLDPTSSEAWLGRAYVQWQAYEYAPAPSSDSLTACYASFRRAVERNPRNDEAWHQFGGALFLVNDSAAEAHLRRALALDPTRAVSYYDLARLAMLERRWDAVETLMDTALTLDPGAPYRGERIRARLASGDTTAALADARADTTSFASRLVRGIFGDDAEARMTLEADTARWRAHEVSYLVATGRSEEAIRAIVAHYQPSANTLYFLRHPEYRAVEDDPRIRALLEASRREQAKVRWR